MEIIGIFFFTILLSLSLSFLFKLLFQSPKHKLPPGPRRLPVFGNIQWLKKNAFSDFQTHLRDLTSRHGPIVTLHLGTKPSIWVADRFLAHQALVQNGAVYADRPPALLTTRVITSDQHDIHSSGYGSLWRALRRNLTVEVLQASRVKSHAPSRRWAFEILIECLETEQRETGYVFNVLAHLRYSMFCLLALMCFGEKLNRDEIKQIEQAQYQMLTSYSKFGVLNVFPRINKIFLRNKWNEFMTLRKHQEDVILSFVNARKKTHEESERVLCYADTLLDFKVPDEDRVLNGSEITSLCSEFLNAGTDPTATALQWIMANMVKYPEIQEKVYEEIKNVVGEQHGVEIKEEDLSKMVYLRAVVLESLRRHPPGHYLSYHRVTEDTVLGGFLVPKNGTINFMVGEIGRDPKVWEDPMAFKPERFLESEKAGQGFDLTGSREIKMMPFGAGRRMCPGYGQAILHLEYFLANLVWKYEWKCLEGENVDLSEKQQFITMIMKNPFKANVVPRNNRSSV